MAEVKALIEGYRDFYKEYFASGDTLYQGLTRDGQHPKTLIISCSDSRVDPSILTRAKPGDIFVIRNVANLVPPFAKNSAGIHGVSAAVEFATCFVNVKHIVVMGHSNCAGIAALLDSTAIKDSDFIGSWVNIASDARAKTLAENPDSSTEVKQNCCEKNSITLSLSNLLTFPWIKSRVENGELKLHGWHFTMENGELQEYNPNSEKFETIAT